MEGILSNPAGFTCNGYALRDCLTNVAPPYVEIHITNLNKRDIKSVVSTAAVVMVQGFGIDSYFVAIEAMLRLLIPHHTPKDLTTSLVKSTTST